MASFSKAVLVLFLLLLAAALWYGNIEYPSVYLVNGSYTALAAAAIYFFFKVVVEDAINYQVKESKRKYSVRKAASVIYLVVLFVTVFTIWVPNPEALFVAYGLVAAGIAIALQDLFKNLAGGVILFFTKIYGVGDRVEINSHFGDVLDIDLFYTTLLETRGWVDGDQATGRLTIIPNGHVLSGVVDNYTKDHDFIWDEISIPLTYGSDWKAAIKLFTDIISKETKKTIEDASREMSRIREKYYLSQRSVEPQIFLTLTDNWIGFRLRYVVPARERREIHNRLNRLLLEGIESSKKLKIASQTVDIVGFPERKK
jgi:small-conductance mechanosensitive channel